MEESMKMVRTAYQALEEKKGQDIRVLDISKISVLADYFIITNGTMRQPGKCPGRQCG